MTWRDDGGRYLSSSVSNLIPWPIFSLSFTPKVWESHHKLQSINELPIKPQSVGLLGFEAFSSSKSRQGRAATFVRETKSCLLLNLILLCGDISINPGPNWKFPYGLCKKPVKCNQRGIQCDSCDSWLHVRCLEMNIDEYEILANSSCTWFCPNCDLPNFETILLESSTSSLYLSNSFNILSEDCNQTSETSRNSSLNISATNAPNHENIQMSGKTPKRNKLRGMMINCNGLKSSKHSAEFKALLELHNPDFVLGTESKLDPGIPTYSIFPPSYTVFRKDRNAHGGGVLHAIKSDLACMEEDGFNGNFCEILWSSTKMTNYKTL